MFFPCRRCCREAINSSRLAMISSSTVKYFLTQAARALVPVPTVRAGCHPAPEGWPLRASRFSVRCVPWYSSGPLLRPAILSSSAQRSSLSRSSLNKRWLASSTPAMVAATLRWLLAKVRHQAAGPQQVYPQQDGHPAFRRPLVQHLLPASVQPENSSASVVSKAVTAKPHASVSQPDLPRSCSIIEIRVPC